MLGVIYTFVVGTSHYEYPEEIMAQTKWVSRNLDMAVKTAFGGLVLGVLCEISSRKNKAEELT
jgi:hypothetical protein